MFHMKKITNAITSLPMYPSFYLCTQIAASLLLFMEEEDAFWMMCAIIEDLLPASYYSSTLLGVQVK